MSKRRRKGRPDGPPKAPTDGDAAPADKAKAERAQGKGRGEQRRPFLGRGFWLYFALMAVVLIPLNLFCLQNTEGGTGEAASEQAAVVLTSIDEPHEPYETDPPTSGPHVLGLVEPGFHDSTIPDEAQVANLEAGYVIVHFDPGAGPALEAEMRQLAAELEGWDVIVQPDPELGPDQVALTAWGRIEHMKAYDKGTVYKFIRTFAGVDRRATTAPASS